MDDLEDTPVLYGKVNKTKIPVIMIKKSHPPGMLSLFLITITTTLV
jgi:hypothetical protein